MSADTQDEATISVVAAEELESRGIFKRSQEIRYGRVDLSVKELRDNLDKFLSSLSSSFSALPDSLAGFNLDSFSVTAEITAKGHVSLLGTGGELAGKGGITFTFNRQRKVSSGGPSQALSDSTRS